MSAHDSENTGRQASPGPVLGAAFHESSQSPSSELMTDDRATEGNTKSGKRRLWGLMRKKQDEKGRAKIDTSSSHTMQKDMTTGTQGQGESTLPTSSVTSHPYSSPSSPPRNLNSSSPAPPSPASSQIFERHVQEDSLANRDQAPVVGHIATENHIPPVLDASTEAITNEKLDPDKVEIITHAAHQPAAMTVAVAGPGEAVAQARTDDSNVRMDNEDTIPSYGDLDSADVRRLSFISFADVVHAEHADHTGLMPSIPSSPLQHVRSPSPHRSPLATQMTNNSSTLSSSAASQNLDPFNPRGLSSPYAGHSPPSGSELTIETMRQALRKTGSGDLSGARIPSVNTPERKFSQTEGSAHT